MTWFDQSRRGNREHCADQPAVARADDRGGVRTHSTIFDRILGFFRPDDDLLFLPILVVETDGKDVEALSDHGSDDAKRRDGTRSVIGISCGVSLSTNIGSTYSMTWQERSL